MDSNTKKTVLVLGGGAPNSTLMAGALCAFAEKRVAFDIVYTSGAGALMGLLFVAPNGKAPEAALRATVELMGVSDTIYQFFPVGYKTFFKPGDFTRPLHRWGQLFKLGQFPPRIQTGYLGRFQDTLKRWHSAQSDLWFRHRGSPFQRLYNDMIDLWLTAINPVQLNPLRKGMSSSFPFLEEMVDFSKLDLFPGQFYMNAFNLTDERMEEFGKYEIEANPEVFRAALAMPFIYPPVEVDGKLYIEGADHDPISFGNLQRRLDHADIKTIVVFDILSSLDSYLVREPRNLWDAYQISIMAPIVALAEKNIQDFAHWVTTQNITRAEKLDAYILQFDIPQAQQHKILDWSYSNLDNLWKLGYATGMRFYDDLDQREETRLPTRPRTLEPGTRSDPETAPRGAWKTVG